MIQIHLDPEVEAKLAAEAEAHGLDIDRFILEKLDIPSLRLTPQPTVKRREAVEAMDRFAKEIGATLGGASLKAMVHEVHKY